MKKKLLLSTMVMSGLFFGSQIKAAYDYRLAVPIQQGGQIGVIDYNGEINYIKKYQTTEKSSVVSGMLGMDALIGIRLTGNNQYEFFDFSGQKNGKYNQQIFADNLGELVKFDKQGNYIYAKPYSENNKVVLEIINGRGVKQKEIILSGQVYSPENMRVVGQSSDGQFLYLAKIGWEGFTYANAWKLKKSNNQLEKIKNIDYKVALDKLTIKPELDLALGVEAVSKRVGSPWVDKQTGPAKINLYNLKTNTYKTIYQSKKMIDSAYLSPNAKYVYFNEGGSLYSIKINGQAKKKLAVDRKIVGIASDGSRLVIVGENVGYDKLKYFELYDFKYGGVIKKIHVDNPLVINCSYPNGFSCYY